ncbi:TPA: restriction endonuclease subunit S [Proteus mirabilis]|nr:restriction endonuclease subunit S [Proteus mirabilis]
MNNGVVEMGLNLIPAGYKQTEVGVIPEDWELKYLGEICNFENGDRSSNYPSAHEFSNSGIPFINAGHVSEGKIDLADMDYIPTHVYERLGGGKVKSGDLVYCLRGSLGKFGVVSDDFGLGAVASSLVIVRPKKSTTTKFVSAYFKSNIAKNMISLWAGGAAQPNLGAKELANFLVPLPDSQEQTAIANALSDVDALISELEKLIAKKQAIKTATMQQLLTGRTRLPQFALREDGTPKGTKPSELGEIPVDWEVVCFSQCGYFQSGSGFPTKYQGKQEGDYPFFKVSDMNNVGNENNLINSNNYISETVRNLISAKLIPVNAIVFAKIGAAIFLERKKICFQTSCIDNNMMAYIVNDKKLYYKYAYLLFKNINLAQFVEATALPSLSGRDIGQKIVALPTSEEQTAIATILSDMDAEIQALEQRLGKTRQIKQGMMQELLTGKTRLPYDKE